MQEILHPTAKMSLSVLDDLVMFVGRRAQDGESVAWLEQQVLSLPTNIRRAYMHVVLPSTDAEALVGESTRRAMMHFVHACQPRLQAGALVLPHGGFVGATVRSVFSAILMAARPSVPVKMFGSPDEGAAWLRQSASCHVPDPARVTQHVRHMAATLGLGAVAAR